MGLRIDEIKYQTFQHWLNEARHDKQLVNRADASWYDWLGRSGIDYAAAHVIAKGRMASLDIVIITGPPERSGMYLYSEREQVALQVAVQF